MGCDGSYRCMCADSLSLVSSPFFTFHSFSSTHSSLGQPFVSKDVAVSDSVVPESLSDTRSPPHIHSASVALGAMTVAPLPQRLSDAEVPIWKLLEGRSGKDKGQNSAGEGSKPLCGG